MPISGIRSISAVRVFMALLWARDILPRSGEAGAPSWVIRLSDLREGAGYGASGSYRQVMEGLRSLNDAAFMTSDGQIIEIFEYVGVSEVEGSRVCFFRTTEEFEAIQQNTSEDGYGLINMSEVTRLARALDFPIYLRACSVRKRRKRSFGFSRSEIFFLSGRDPEGPIGGAMRAIRISTGRVGAVLQTEARAREISSFDRERIKGIEVRLASSNEVEVDLA